MGNVPLLIKGGVIIVVKDKVIDFLLEVVSELKGEISSHVEKWEKLKDLSDTLAIAEQLLPRIDNSDPLLDTICTILYRRIREIEVKLTDVINSVFISSKLSDLDELNKKFLLYLQTLTPALLTKPAKKKGSQTSLLSSSTQISLEIDPVLKQKAGTIEYIYANLSESSQNIFTFNSPEKINMKEVQKSVIPQIFTENPQLTILKSLMIKLPVIISDGVHTIIGASEKDDAVLIKKFSQIWFSKMILGSGSEEKWVWSAIDPKTHTQFPADLLWVDCSQYTFKLQDITYKLAEKSIIKFAKWLSMINPNAPK